MAKHSTILAREIPWTEEHGWLQSMGSQSTGHNWATKRQQTSLTSAHRPSIITNTRPLFHSDPYTLIRSVLSFFQTAPGLVLFWLHWILDAARGIQFPDQGSNPGPLNWEHGVLATGPLRKFLFCSLHQPSIRHIFSTAYWTYLHFLIFCPSM